MSRVLGLVGALVIGFAAAVMIVLGSDLGDQPICKDTPKLLGGYAEDCFDISSTTLKSISEVAAYAAGAIGVIAALLGLAFVFTGRNGRRFLTVAGVAIAVGAVSFLVAQF